MRTRIFCNLTFVLLSTMALVASFGTLVVGIKNPPEIYLSLTVFNLTTLVVLCWFWYCSRLLSKLEKQEAAAKEILNEANEPEIQRFLRRVESKLPGDLWDG